MTLIRLGTLMLLVPWMEIAAGEISGRASDTSGEGLPGVRICLTRPALSPEKCLRTQYTDLNGDYAFRNISKAGTYLVSVRARSTVGSGPSDRYANLVWSPSSQRVVQRPASQTTRDIDFSGEFNFGNFRPELQITASDLPELAQFDPASDYVFLKLYSIDSFDLSEQLIFLGRVIDASTLQVKVSVALPVTQLHYEIYSARAPEPVLGTLELGS